MHNYSQRFFYKNPKAQEKKVKLKNHILSNEKASA
jgi:hypothetical protein